MTAIAATQAQTGESERVLIVPDAPAERGEITDAFSSAGTSEHFEVAYHSDLGDEGARLGKVVLESVEADYTELHDLFGVKPSEPVVVKLIPGSSGVRRGGSGMATVTCDAFNGTRNNTVHMLIHAQLAELFMEAKANQWDCGTSAGEALSRVLAVARYPDQRLTVPSAGHWINSPSRPDYITANKADDQDLVAIGCAKLFIDYLRHHLGIGLTNVVAAGGPTLADTYKSLTGKEDAWSAFKKLIDDVYPPGRGYFLPTDTLFPVPRITGIRRRGLLTPSPQPGKADAKGGGELEITFDGPAPAQLDVTLTSNQPTLVAVPERVEVIAGAESLTVPVTVGQVPPDSDPTVYVTALCGGGAGYGMHIRVVDVSGFCMLLDTAPLDPALGFKGVAEAFAEICRASAPQFAIGVFGGWGQARRR